MTLSDQTTPVSTLKEQVRTFIEARDWDQFHTPKDLAIGLITEASELLELFRFRKDEEVAQLLGEADFQVQVQHELADCFYFVLAIANKLDFDLVDIFQAKMAISAKNYPEELASGRNVKYTELAEDSRTESADL